MKLLVSGGRDNADRGLIFDVLDLYHATYHISELIHGAARGTDTFCAEWAKQNRVRPVPYPVTKADWQEYGGWAGHRRNQMMLDKERPDLVIVFPGMNGTLDLLKRAIKYQETENMKAHVIRIERAPPIEMVQHDFGPLPQARQAAS